MIDTSAFTVMQLVLQGELTEASDLLKSLDQKTQDAVISFVDNVLLFHTARVRKNWDNVVVNTLESQGIDFKDPFVDVSISSRMGEDGGLGFHGAYL